MISSVIPDVIEQAFLVHAISYSSFLARMFFAAVCMDSSLHSTVQPFSASTNFWWRMNVVSGGMATVGFSHEKFFSTSEAARILSRANSVDGITLSACALIAARFSSQGTRVENPSEVIISAASLGCPVRYLIAGSLLSSLSSNTTAPIFFSLIIWTSLSRRPAYIFFRSAPEITESKSFPVSSVIFCSIFLSFFLLLY